MASSEFGALQQMARVASIGLGKAMEDMATALRNPSWQPAPRPIRRNGWYPERPKQRVGSRGNR